MYLDIIDLIISRLHVLVIVTLLLPFLLNRDYAVVIVLEAEVEHVHRMQLKELQRVDGV